MDNRLLWAVAAIIVIGAAILYFATSGSVNQPAKEPATPHAIDQGQG